MPTQRKPIGQRRRFALLLAAGFRCTYCGRAAPEVTLQLDHRIPLAAGGTDDSSNMVVACTSCNAGKAALVVLAGPRQRCLNEWHLGPFELERLGVPGADQPRLVVWCRACCFIAIEMHPDGRYEILGRQLVPADVPTWP